MYIVGGDKDDLIQEGMIGLYKAVTTYDELKAASFATFASLCINGQLMNAVKASNAKKIPRLIPMYHLIRQRTNQMMIQI